MIGADKLSAPVIQIEKLAWRRRQVFERGFRNVGPFEVLRPGAPQLEDIAVQRLQGGQPGVGNVLLDDDQKVDIAEEVEVTDGEGAVQVCAYEIRAEDGLNPATSSCRTAFSSA